ncbi:MAG: winged helix-turn-helix domain-containing protein [Candidatus Bathyarchaeaceae archaeon]
MKNELEENLRRRRDRLYIISEILTIAKDGSLKTQIMYRANLSFAQLNEYLSFLLKIKLLKIITENERTIYKTTTRGIKYLENYDKITGLLSEEEDSGSRNSPILLSRRNPMGYR